MLLSILIPTYNRSKLLMKNLEILKVNLTSLKQQVEIELVISNNCSTDDTDKMVLQFSELNSKIKVRYFIQKENIGLENNALIVLKEARGEYVMYLGDDDFISKNYLEGIISKLISNPEISCIIPAINSLSVKGIVKPSRDVGINSKIYSKGFKNCLTNSWRGHQLSGLVLKRGGLYKAYMDKKVNNIYPFIFFVGYSCLTGNTFHFTQFPVKVSVVDQSKKDWNYGKDGLINEVFDNYKKLPLNIFQKTELEFYFMRRQSGRLWKYKEKGNSEFLDAFYNVWMAKNGTYLFKLIFPIGITAIRLKNNFRRIISI